MSQLWFFSRLEQNCNLIRSRHSTVYIDISFKLDFSQYKPGLLTLSYILGWFVHQGSLFAQDGEQRGAGPAEGGRLGLQPRRKCLRKGMKSGAKG